MRARRVLIGTAALGAAALLGVPAGAQTPRPTQSRPHSSVVIRDSYNVAVDRLSANVQPDRGRLRVRIDFSARSRSPDKRAVVLRAGRCVRGQLSAPSCPPAFSRRVVLYPDKTVHITANAFLRRPPKRQDAIRITVTIPGKVKGARPIAELFLRGSAWRKLAGRDFGYAIHSRPGVSVRAVRAYGAGVSTEQLRGTFTWEARSSANLDAKTRISPCFEEAPKCAVAGRVDPADGRSGREVLPAPDAPAPGRFDLHLPADRDGQTTSRCSSCGCPGPGRARPAIGTSRALSPV